MTPSEFAASYLNGFDVQEANGWVLATAKGYGRSVSSDRSIDNEAGLQQIAAAEWHDAACAPKAEQHYTVAVVSAQTPDVLGALGMACRLEMRFTSPLDIVHLGEPSSTTKSALEQFAKSGRAAWVIV